MRHLSSSKRLFLIVIIYIILLLQFRLYRINRLMRDYDHKQLSEGGQMCCYRVTCHELAFTFIPFLLSSGVVHPLPLVCWSSSSSESTKPPCERAFNAITRELDLKWKLEKRRAVALTRDLIKGQLKCENTFVVAGSSRDHQRSAISLRRSLCNALEIRV